MSLLTKFIKRYKKFFLYMLRWQLSSIILYPCVALLPFSPLVVTIVANLIGGAIFFPIDIFIFKK